MKKILQKLFLAGLEFLQHDYFLLNQKNLCTSKMSSKNESLDKTMRLKNSAALFVDLVWGLQKKTAQLVHFYSLGQPGLGKQRQPRLLQKLFLMMKNLLYE